MLFLWCSGQRYLFGFPGMRLFKIFFFVDEVLFRVQPFGWLRVVYGVLGCAPTLAFLFSPGSGVSRSGNFIGVSNGFSGGAEARDAF